MNKKKFDSEHASVIRLIKLVNKANERRNLSDHDYDAELARLIKEKEESMIQREITSASPEDMNPKVVSKKRVKKKIKKSSWTDSSYGEL